MRIVGAGAKMAPTADAARRAPGDAHLWRGRLWIMWRGSWKGEVEAEGAKGKGEMGVPVPAVSTNTARMTAPLGALLAVLGLVLLAGLVGIIGAANREANLATGGKAPTGESKKSFEGTIVEGGLMCRGGIFRIHYVV